MKYFLDTEFIEYPNSIELISIGIVSADGREYYGISNEFNVAHASDWVRDNVINKLPHHIGWKTIATLKKEILDFIGDDQPEFWGYYSDYDWVVFCWIFGTMMDLPKNFPMYCRDLKQVSDMFDVPKFEEPKGEHNALVDARWNRDLYRHILSYMIQNQIKTIYIDR